MKFSTKTRYALRAMIEIAESDENNKIFQKDISQRQSISPKYLDQIIQSLKAAGLIKNLNGRKSGYRLAQKASEISVLQIHTAFEPEIAVVECLSENINCEMEEICCTNEFWNGLNRLIIDYFQNITLEDLIKKKESTHKEGGLLI